MEKFKGTPGPWFEHREGFSTVYVEAKIIGGLIQEVAACGPTESGQEAQYANARLIAAAPDLLEALQQVLSSYEGVIEHEFSIPWNEDDACVNARAAIARALGKNDGEE